MGPFGPGGGKLLFYGSRINTGTFSLPFLRFTSGFDKLNGFLTLVLKIFRQISQMNAGLPVPQVAAAAVFLAAFLTVGDDVG